MNVKEGGGGPWTFERRQRGGDNPIIRSAAAELRELEGKFENNDANLNVIIKFQ